MSSKARTTDHPFDRDSIERRRARYRSGTDATRIRFRTHGLDDSEERVRANKPMIQPSAGYEEYLEDPFESLRDPYEDEED